MAEKRARANQIIIRMNDEEYAKYQKKLEISKLSQNQYGIKSLLEQQINVVENMPELIRELKGLGNNLNQIARVVNSTGKAPSKDDLTVLSRGVSAIWLWLRHVRVGGL